MSKFYALPYEFLEKIYAKLVKSNFYTFISYKYCIIKG